MLSIQPTSHTIKYPTFEEEAAKQAQRNQENIQKIREFNERGQMRTREEHKKYTDPILLDEHLLKLIGEMHGERL
jgi:hypothetical protein